MGVKRRERDNFSVLRDNSRCLLLRLGWKKVKYRRQEPRTRNSFVGKRLPLIWGWPCFRWPEEVRSGILGIVGARDRGYGVTPYWIIPYDSQEIRWKCHLTPACFSWQPRIESILSVAHIQPGLRWCCSAYSFCLSIFLLSVHLVKSYPFFKVHHLCLSLPLSRVSVSLTWVSRAHWTSVLYASVCSS